MAGSVRADLDTMRGVSQAFANDYGSLVSTMSRLKSDADNFSASWKGSGAVAFRNAHEAVEAAWSSLNTVLDEIAANISKAGTGYNNQDSANAASFNKVPTTGISTSLST